MENGLPPEQQSSSNPIKQTSVDPNQIQISVKVAPGTQVRITLESLSTRATPAEAPPQPTYTGISLAPSSPPPTTKTTVSDQAFPRLKKPAVLLPSMVKAWRRISSEAAVRWSKSTAWATQHKLAPSIILFALGLLIYAITRLWGIDRFPIFFYSDEVNNVLFGKRILSNGFKDVYGNWLPLYFQADAGRWAPVLPSYIQALSAGIFGNSIFVARATTALVSITAVVASGLILKDIFQLRLWWTVSLLLSLTPAWFLYTRTAFETVMATSFLACFLLLYLLYRCRSARWLYPAMLAGALAFYSYSTCSFIIAVLAILLLLIDYRYHLKNWRVGIGGLLLAVVLAWPLIHFRSKYPTAFETNLKSIQSYWAEPISLGQKLLHYGANYLHGLSPSYWLLADNGESRSLPNQHMDNVGHLGIITPPLMVIGLLICLWKIRSPAHRILLLATLAIPSGAALDSIEIPRVLAFVIPANLLAGLGLEWLSNRMKRPSFSNQTILLFFILSISAFAMLQNALVSGPLWDQDYGLYGMQYGARPVFEEIIPKLLKQYEQEQILISPIWANHPEVYTDFFIPADQRERVKTGTLEDCLTRKCEYVEHTIFILTTAEYQYAASTAALKQPIQVIHTADYPNHQPAFYAIAIAYADNADQVFAAEAQERRQPIESQVTIGEQTVDITYSKISDGDPTNLFDNNFDTLMVGQEANPFIIIFQVPEPRSMTAIRLTVGSMDNFTVTIRAKPADDSGRIEYSQQFLNQGPDPTVELTFSNTPVQISTLEVEIHNNQMVDTAMIHIRELVFH